MKGYLNIQGSVNQPEKFHKERPIKGLDCPRSEISGKRLWDLASRLSNGKAVDFFKHAYVHNYFPLAFVSKTAKNITPAELKVIKCALVVQGSVCHVKFGFDYCKMFVSCPENLIWPRTVTGKDDKKD